MSLKRIRSIYSSKARIVLVFLLSLPLSSCWGPSVSVQELREEIEKELPKGTAVSDVMSFLDSRGISHSEYVEGKLFDLNTNGYVDERLINARILSVKRRLFEEYDIAMTFWFDENKRLTRYKAIMRSAEP